ncbi:hypothetical protein Q1695_014091 [Nippostrongylus brasiliensis]|nr:hypothetical protein Q1695_014091 [Nippostrongylus brasiliensis]
MMKKADTKEKNGKKISKKKNRKGKERLLVSPLIAAINCSRGSSPRSPPATAFSGSHHHPRSCRTPISGVVSRSVVAAADATVFGGGQRRSSRRQPRRRSPPTATAAAQ